MLFHAVLLSRQTTLKVISHHSIREEVVLSLLHTMLLSRQTTLEVCFGQKSELSILFKLSSQHTTLCPSFILNSKNEVSLTTQYVIVADEASLAEGGCSYSCQVSM